MKAAIEHARAAHLLLAKGGQWLGRESIQDYRDRINRAQIHAQTSIALSLVEHFNPDNADVIEMANLPALGVERGDEDE